MVEDAISFWTEIQRYEDRLAADPRSLCFVELSALYRKLGLLDDAVSVAKKGSDLHPDYPAGFYVLGSSCYAKGLFREARQALERTVELEPGHLEAARLLSQLYIEGGELARAGGLLREIVRQHPDDVETGLLLRSIGGEGGSYAAEEEALEELEEVEVIEELTEVLDEPQEEPASPVSGTAPQGARGEKVAAAAVPAPAAAAGAADPFAIFAEENPLWDTGEAGQPSPSDQPDQASQSDDWSDFFAPPPAPEPTAAPHSARDPLTTATLAELYVTQGFIDKALGIYRELQAADPANQAYRSRCADLEELKRAQGEPPAAQAERPAAAPSAAHPAPPEAAPPAARFEAPKAGLPAAESGEPAAAYPLGGPLPSTGASGDPYETELCHWLANIRRRRDGV